LSLCTLMIRQFKLHVKQNNFLLSFPHSRASHWQNDIRTHFGVNSPLHLTILISWLMFLLASETNDVKTTEGGCWEKHCTQRRNHHRGAFLFYIPQIPYLPVYKSTFQDLKIILKNRPRLIHRSKIESQAPAKQVLHN